MKATFHMRLEGPFSYRQLHKVSLQVQDLTFLAQDELHQTLAALLSHHEHEPKVSK